MWAFGDFSKSGALGGCPRFAYFSPSYFLTPSSRVLPVSDFLALPLLPNLAPVTLVSELKLYLI